MLQWLGSITISLTGGVKFRFALVTELLKNQCVKVCQIEKFICTGGAGGGGQPSQLLGHKISN